MFTASGLHVRFLKVFEKCMRPIFFLIEITEFICFLFGLVFYFLNIYLFLFDFFLFVQRTIQLQSGCGTSPKKDNMKFEFDRTVLHCDSEVCFFFVHISPCVSSVPGRGKRGNSTKKEEER